MLHVRPRANARPSLRRQTSPSSHHARALVHRLARRPGHTIQVRNEGVPPQPQPTATDESGSRTLRTRRHGQASLPLPPLMDPILVGARLQHTAPKPCPEPATQTAFQRELALNVYALALATPVRMCTLTGFRLPTHFMQPFSAVYAAEAVQSPAANDDNDTDPSKPPDATSDPASPAARPSLKAQLEPCTPAQLDGAPGATGTSYVLNRRSLLEKVTASGEKKGWGPIASRPLLDHFARECDAVEAGIGVKLMRRWLWHSDMPARVLEAHRSSVVVGLRRLGKARGHLFVPVGGEEYGRGEVAFTVTVAEEEGTLADEQGERLEKESEGEQEGTSALDVPHYNVRRMVGEPLHEILTDRLRTASKWALLKDPHSAKLQLRLERLRMYDDNERAQAAV